MSSDVSLAKSHISLILLLFAIDRDLIGDVNFILHQEFHRPKYEIHLGSKV